MINFVESNGTGNLSNYMLYLGFYHPYIRICVSTTIAVAVAVPIAIAIAIAITIADKLTRL
jgi:ABC-type phosphate transport system permease subunit